MHGLGGAAHPQAVAGHARSGPPAALLCSALFSPLLPPPSLPRCCSPCPPAHPRAVFCALPPSRFELPALLLPYPSPAVNRIVLDAYNANLHDLACHQEALAAAADGILEREILTGG